MRASTKTSATIRVGIGGWVFPPWRNNFYPAGLPHARELEHSSRMLSAIEINSTFHGPQKPATFVKWRDETPEDFMFSVKAPKFATNRTELAKAGETIQRFVNGGVTELGHKLGPIVWQFAPTKLFDPVDFEAFLRLLPPDAGGLTLRHALDVRHASFMSAGYLALARRYQAATVFTDSDDYPSFADVTGGFIYTRMMRTDAARPEGCTKEALTLLAARAQAWRDGNEPPDVPRIEAASPPTAPRDVFMFFISGAKEKAPAAAMALLRCLA